MVKAGLIYYEEHEENHLFFLCALCVLDNCSCVILLTGVLP